MPLNQFLLQELEQESINTRKMLQRVPEEHFGWKPHEKSNTLGRLASHVAEITHWISRALSGDEYDLAEANFKPANAATSSELMQIFEDKLAKAKEDLQTAGDDVFTQKWKLRHGEQVMFELPKIAVIRSVALNHIIHHRAQLSVYLRLLNIPVPGMYGPTADERI